MSTVSQTVANWSVFISSTCKLDVRSSKPVYAASIVVLLCYVMFLIRLANRRTLIQYVAHQDISIHIIGQLDLQFGIWLYTNGAV